MKIHLFHYYIIMKKILLLGCLCSLIATSVVAQDEPKSSKKKYNLSGRANDHFMIQLGITNWSKKPDSIQTKGLSRSFNMYFMFDFPMKSNQRMSVGIGLGLASDNMYFEKTYVGIKDLTPTLVFNDLSDTNHYKKNKLNTTWLEVPLELRFSSKPDQPNKSNKFAIGLRVGTLLSGMYKAKTLRNKDGNDILPYTLKEKSKRFFNTNRFVATARFSHGVFGIFGSYQINALFKEGFAPEVRPYTIGLTLSGL
jgi:hypothetical protein